MQPLHLCDNVAASMCDKTFDRSQPKFNLTPKINVQASLQLTALFWAITITKNYRRTAEAQQNNNMETTLWGIKKHTKMCFAITFVKLDGF